ncbi:MAG TPA: hypothetical protein VGK30_02875 [Candidatus Binatia bacterium]
MSLAQATAPPDWIEVRHGASALVLFAPHGGSRNAPRRPGRDNVNDLHTAELTRELGAACDATWIVNPTRDRNELDLNRAEQLQRRAPWLLELLAATLETAARRHGRAVLLAIHGWNVGQPVCDLGVGLIEEHGRGCRRAARGAATVSPAFLDGPLRELQRLAAEDGTTVTIGARYPAAHPSNVMQLLTPTRADDPDPLIRRLAGLAATVEATQLELGIPLRWPGRRRCAFLRRLIEVFSPASSGRSIASPPHARTVPLACGGRPITRVGLQVASGPLALLTSIDVTAAGAAAGRVLVSDGPDRLSLFTGELSERPSPALCVPPLRIVARGRHAFDVRFAGAMLAFPMLTPFSDLERGLAAGSLVDARIALRFIPDGVDEIPSGAARFGTVAGTVRLGHTRHRVRGRAHAAEGLPWPAPFPAAHLVLPDTTLGHLDLWSHASSDDTPGATDPGAGGVTLLPVAGTAWNGNGPVAIRGAIEIDHLPPTGVRLRLETADGATHVLASALERRIPVRRPGREGSVVETFFAICRATGTAPGWLDLTVEHPPDAD